MQTVKIRVTEAQAQQLSGVKGRRLFSALIGAIEAGENSSSATLGQLEIIEVLKGVNSNLGKIVELLTPEPEAKETPTAPILLFKNMAITKEDRKKAHTARDAYIAFRWFCERQKIVSNLGQAEFTKEMESLGFRGGITQGRRTIHGFSIKPEYLP